MKTRFLNLLLPLLVAVPLAHNVGAQTVPPRTAFTYQGRLSGSPNNTYDLRFRLYDESGTKLGELPSLGVTTINDVFTIKLDFGSDPFTRYTLPNVQRWLEMDVKQPGEPDTAFVTMPRVELTPAPTAIYAQAAEKLTGSLPAGQLSGTYSSALTLNNSGNIFSGNGAGLTGLAADNIGSGTLADTRLSGNVALLNRAQTFTGDNSFGNLNIYPPSKLSFGASTRQMINLWDTRYGIGVQPSTHYFRADIGASFAWFTGGVHTDAFLDPGAGGTTLMSLSSSGGLNLSRNTPLFSGLEVDGAWTGAQPGDLTTSYFLRARASRKIPSHGSPQTEMVPVFLVRGDGNVGIGTDNPTRKLELQGNADVEIGLKSTDSDGHLWTLQSSRVAGDNLDASFQIIDRTAGASRLMIDTGGQVSIAGNLNVSGNASVCSLTVRGGCDLAEPFQISGREIPKGSLVIIDEENPGKLKLAEREYDTRVAGIISGANGINPGISLHQEGAIEGGQNVALSGRVYALADASNEAIKPGDLLTSSGTAGHLMKVTDHLRAHGAIVGKAMSGLKEGKGTVLVLVSLQ